jgi:hypothetical protein
MNKKKVMTGILQETFIMTELVLPFHRNYSHCFMKQIKKIKIQMQLKALNSSQCIRFSQANTNIESEKELRYFFLLEI